MAGETILVVDDTPVNLKLTDILLRKEGYCVHVAADPDQALALAGDVHPDLMLVDAELAGMGGLELMRRIKRDDRTRDIVVVALAAGGASGDDGRALEAGCDGYIATPIQTLTLAKQVREYLGLRSKAPGEVAVEGEAAPAATPGFPGGISLSSVEMEGVRRRFLGDTVSQIQKLIEGLGERLDVRKTLRLVQDCARAAEILDYSAVAALAHEVEKLLRTGPPNPKALREALSNLMLALVEPPEAGMGPVPDFIAEALSGKRIALVGFSGEEAEQLCGALERASARPRLFDARVLDGDAVRDCSVAMVRVQPETQDSFLLRPRAGAALLILAGPRDQILALDKAAPLRAHDLLIDGWQPEEALMRIAFALLRAERVPVEAPAEPGPGTAVVPGAAEALGLSGEVLLADDDLTVRLLMRSAFQGVGIKCLLAANGIEALQMLRDYRPAVAVLDINMPAMDGYEVLAAARGEGISTRVLLLTARQQEADVTRGFTLGADDYVVKPFNPVELVARVKRLLKG